MSFANFAALATRVDFSVVAVSDKHVTCCAEVLGDHAWFVTAPLAEVVGACGDERLFARIFTGSIFARCRIVDAQKDLAKALGDAGVQVPSG
jgi:hypothetical protein